MTLKIISLEQKITTIDKMLDTLREAGVRSQDPEQFATMAAIAADLRGRQQLTRSQTLGELTRALGRLERSKTALGYEAGRLVEVANLLISKWPTVSQALEQFGEETAE